MQDPQALAVCSVLLPFRKLFLTQIFPYGGSDQEFLSVPSWTWRADFFFLFPGLFYIQLVL